MGRKSRVEKLKKRSLELLDVALVLIFRRVGHLGSCQITQGSGFAARQVVDTRRTSYVFDHFCTFLLGSRGVMRPAVGGVCSRWSGYERGPKGRASVHALKALE